MVAVDQQVVEIIADVKEKTGVREEECILIWRLALHDRGRYYYSTNGGGMMMTSS